LNSTGASTENYGNRLSWISVGFATPSYQDALPSCQRPALRNGEARAVNTNSVISDDTYRVTCQIHHNTYRAISPTG